MAVSFFIYMIIKTKRTAIENEMLNNSRPIDFIATFLYSSSKTKKSGQEPYEKEGFFHDSFAGAYAGSHLST
ncbi:hypothetical protein C6W18_17145 [Bacillus sp. LLTC93]|uniref:Uncharacterized protein n=1 Tax=Bacillus zhangzhouensis TaxID=1178540 RepID=A0A081L9T8_9BACI|nr:hypothetical protein BA70_04250 [Bacillus zhangzhouensis]PRO40002.1 hypothetical protein C6W18_17145 [Bacillus sp. LLTC93]